MAKPVPFIAGPIVYGTMARDLGMVTEEGVIVKFDGQLFDGKPIVRLDLGPGRVFRGWCYSHRDGSYHLVDHGNRAMCDDRCCSDHPMWDTPENHGKIGDRYCRRCVETKAAGGATIRLKRGPGDGR